VWKDHEGFQAFPGHLDLLVPRVLLVEEEERELRVPLDPRENEVAEDYQDPPDLQARLVNQYNVKQVLVVDVS